MRLAARFDPGCGPSPRTSASRRCSPARRRSASAGACARCRTRSSNAPAACSPSASAASRPPPEKCRRESRSRSRSPTGRGCRASTSRPPARRPHPGVVVLHESFGLNDDIRRIAARFAQAGYAALAPSLYSHGRQIVCLSRVMVDMTAARWRARSADIHAVREALAAARRRWMRERIAVAGFCQGGGFALIAGTRPGFSAAAVNYGACPRSARSSTACARSSPATAPATACSVAPMAERLEDHLSALGVPARREGLRRRRALVLLAGRRLAGLARADALADGRRLRRARRPRTAGGACSSSSPSTSEDARAGASRVAAAGVAGVRVASYMPLTRPTTWPSGSANSAIVGPLGTSIGSWIVLPPSCGDLLQRRRGVVHFDVEGHVPGAALGGADAAVDAFLVAAGWPCSRSRP